MILIYLTILTLYIRSTTISVISRMSADPVSPLSLSVPPKSQLIHQIRPSNSSTPSYLIISMADLPTLLSLIRVSHASNNTATPYIWRTLNLSV